MLKQLPYTVSLDLIETALTQLPSDDFRFTINSPSGDFFYEPWNLKTEFVGTVWETLYNSLNLPKGEARIIKLDSKECYTSHADIDDRYHLNLFSKKSFLIDLDNNIMHELTTNGYWYEMNAGIRHTACNFGNRIRYQLVIRKLLTKGSIKKFTRVTITPHNNIDIEDARFIFDDMISPWLNAVNKNSLMDNFNFKNGIVTFDIDNMLLKELKIIIPKEFKLIYL